MIQKLYLLLGLLLAKTLVAQGQHTEWSMQLESGLFSFRGNQVVRESFFNIGPEPQGPHIPGSRSYTNDPWSSRGSFSWGVTMQAQRVTRSKFILGLQLGYEALGTVTQIRRGYDYIGQLIAFEKGRSIFHYEYINVHPFIGRRFGNQRMSIDLTAGIDAAFGLFNWEKGRATTAANALYFTYRQRSILPLDLRPRLNIVTYYRHIGLSLGYSYGLSNYSDGLVGGPAFSTTSQFWRVGVVYRALNKRIRNRSTSGGYTGKPVS